jgi:ABC-type proline/glycine betaine transport system ATPase subunit
MERLAQRLEVAQRALTSHTYNEVLADEIFAALPAYRALMQDWLAALSRS